MNARIAAVVWFTGALTVGCQSQEGQLSASVSLQTQAEEQKRSIYDEVELIAGSGAEEDEPAEPDEEPAYDPEPELEPDAGTLEQRAQEEMSYSDDSHMCGNGEIDEGELCDTAIVEGEGVCPDECDPAPGCPDEVLVIRGCSTRCMAETEPSEECLANR
jgi:hypothetical protein